MHFNDYKLLSMIPTNLLPPTFVKVWRKRKTFLSTVSTIVLAFLTLLFISMSPRSVAVELIATNLMGSFKSIKLDMNSGKTFLGLVIGYCAVNK